jgi:hypothetical protein
MRALEDLINVDEPALPLIHEWIAKAVRPVELLPPSPARDDALLQTQVTTRSPLGTIVYETGGILIDLGWLRVLGSGHDRLTRTLPGWNEGRCDGFYLVAGDAVGGFFAINGGALGPAFKDIYYFAPDLWSGNHSGWALPRFSSGPLVQSWISSTIGFDGRGGRPMWPSCTETGASFFARHFSLKKAKEVVRDPAAYLYLCSTRGTYRWSSVNNSGLPLPARSSYSRRVTIRNT